MNSILVILFYILLFIHTLFLFGKTSLPLKKILVYITIIFLCVLMCGHYYVGNGDSRDFYGYWNDYQTLKSSGEIRDFTFYYLFYLSQIIAIRIGLSFYAWWAMMTIFWWFVITKTMKTFGFRYSYFLFYFMLYYIFTFYTGLKFLYGFSFMLIGVAYFVSNHEKKNILFILFTLMAGGMHVMYYLFLFLLLFRLPIIKSKHIFLFSISLFVIILLIGPSRFQNAISPLMEMIFGSLDSDNLNNYVLSRVNIGYIIPVGLHLLTLLYVKKYRKYVYIQVPEDIEMADNLLSLNLICVLFYPLFLYALTFTRLITAFSLITLTISGKSFKYFSLRRKTLICFWGLLIIIAYIYYNFILNDYFEYSYIPLFDNYYIKNIFDI